MYNKKKIEKKVSKTFGSFKKLPYLCGALRKQVKNRQKKNKKKSCEIVAGFKKLL